MDDAALTDLGLFPLGLVLLPGEHVPLHIFEPRYRALIADCTLGAQPFVLSLATDDGVAKIGCTAHPNSLLRRFDDGRINLIVEGGARVEIVEQTSGEPYLTAKVRALPDLDEPVDGEAAAAVQAQYRRLAHEVAGAAHDPAVRDDVPLSYAVAGAIELEAGVKQRLLEARSENERLGLVQAILDAAVAELDRKDVAAARAHTNGKVTLQ